MADGALTQETEVLIEEVRVEVSVVIRHVPPPPVGLLPAIQSLLYVLVVALFVITFSLQPIRIPSASMEPTLLIGDFLLMNKQTGAGGFLLPPLKVKRGDVIVFHDPVDDPSIHLVKRVVGIPGDHLHLRDGAVFLNGQQLNEPYAVHRPAAVDHYRDDFPDLQTMQPSVNPNWWISLRHQVREGDITVPPGSYFVMGDNRNNSEDSRYWGFVPQDAIVGRPLLIYFSWRQPGDDEDADSGIIRRDTSGPAASIARWDRTFRVVR